MNKPLHSLIPITKLINKESVPYKINFHCHTIHSDGSLQPVELYKQANTLGLNHLAITDHHSKRAYIEIFEFINNSKNSIEFKTRLWTGIEITGLLNGCLVHIIGLGFDINSTILDPYCAGESVNGTLLEADVIVENIRNANGLSFLAHPARYRLPFNELILEAKSIGIDGVEVWYDYERNSAWKYSPFICEEVNKLILKLDMLASCGTDTHGLSLLTR